MYAMYVNYIYYITLYLGSVNAEYEFTDFDIKLALRIEEEVERLEALIKTRD